MSRLLKKIISSCVIVFAGLSSANAVDWSSSSHGLLGGDYNSDGLEDLYLQAVPTARLIPLLYNLEVSISLVDGIKDSVLINNGDGTYTIVYNPDPSTIASVNWVAPANHKLVFNDFNSDGIQDAFVQALNGSATSLILFGLSSSTEVPIIDQSFVGSNILPTQGSSISNGNYVGAIPGDFSVSSTGKANYRLPISLPPSAGNIAPDLSLVYSGVTSNSELGMGWYLSGVSKITRCATTLDQDGYNNTVNFNSSDKFCLNGERLVAISGLYGASNTEYRTENETYTKVVSYNTQGNGPQYFRVWYANGLIEEFGNSLSSRLEASGSSSVVTWGINESKDREGNIATFVYINTKVTGELYIDDISFTGDNSVEFSYEARSDVTPSNANSTLTSLRSRLDSITTRVAGTAIRTYNLGYATGNATKRSRLISVDECISGTCKPATTFTWDLGTEQVVFTEQGSQTDTSSYPSGVVYENQQYQLADVNADGKSDLIWTYRNNNALGRVLYTANNTGGGFTKQSQDLESGYNAALIADADQQYLTGDVNGDGRADLIWVARHLNDFYRVIYLAKTDGTGFVSQGFEVDGHTNYSLSDKGQFQSADVNGDGRSDLVWVFTYLNRVGRAVYLSSADAQGRVSFNKVSIEYDDDLTPQYYTNKQFVTGDVNGDRKADLVWTYTYRNQLVRVLYLANANGTGFSKISLGIESNILPISDLYRDQKFQMGDINGDGKSDLVWTYNYNNQLGRVVYQASPLGTSFTEVSNVLDPVGSITPNNHTFAQSRLADLNGDGLTDMVYTYNENSTFGWVAFQANMDGKGFTQVNSQTTANSSQFHQNQDYLLGDINADGKTDLVWVYNNTSNTQGYHVLTLPKSNPDHIGTITDGLGVQQIIDYKYLAEGGAFYSKGAAATYPLRDDNGLSYVVSRVRKSNGVGGLSQWDYAYKGAKTHLRGRGFVGFEERTISDAQSGFTTTEKYWQEFPYVGLVQSSVLARSNGNPLEKVYNHWKQETIPHTGTDTIFRFLKDQAVIKYDFDDGGVIFSSLVINNYNNNFGTLDNSSLVVGRGFTGAINASYQPLGSYTSAQVSAIERTVTTTNTFDNNSTNWRIGFISSQLVNFVIPDAGPAGQLNQTVVTSSTPYDTYRLLPYTETGFTGSNVELTHTYTRDTYGNIRNNLTTGRDIDGTSITSRNDSFGIYADGMYPDYAQNQLNHRENFAYNIRIGVASSVTDVNNHTTTSTYDDFGRVLHQQHPDGSLTVNTYETCTSACPAHAVTKVTSLLGNIGVMGSPITSLYLDQLGREVSTETQGFDGRLIRIDTSYDARGRVATVSEPYYLGETKYNTVYTYDDLNRVKTENRPNGASASFSYGSDATYAINTTVTTTVVNPVAANKVVSTTSRSNSLGQLMEVRDANNTLSHYKYNAQGELSWTRVDNIAATDISVTYDIAGNKTQLVDPDAGTINYAVDSLGQQRRITQQPGALKPHITTDVFDTIGRISFRVDNDGVTTKTSNWYYDGAANGIGLVDRITAEDYDASYLYDGLSRLRQSNTKLLGDLVGKTFSYTYDDFGRADTTTYPSGLVVQNQYNVNGYQNKINNYTTGETLSLVSERDARANATQETYGNSLITARNYHANTGQINSIQTGTVSDATSVQNLAYQFDSENNLVTRSSNATYRLESLQETFVYDNLFRLDTATTTGLSSGARSLNYDYDALGNIKTKSDVSDVNGYSYGTNGGGIHAVSSVVKAGITKQYHYDTKGNMTTRGDTTIAYSLFNKPLSITKTGVQTDFKYGPDRKRFYQLNNDNGRITETHYYNGGSYEEVQEGTIIRKKAYVGDFLVHITQTDTVFNGSSEELTYLHKDHIGSTEALTNHVGFVKDRMIFAPFGQRRQQSWEETDPAYQGGIADVTFENTSRGFTGHEHLDSVGIIHMNGRIYDPALGRFMNADDFVQMPTLSQSYNRYSYVLNNPLKYKDENGECFGLCTAVGTVGFIAWRAYSAVGTIESTVETIDTFTSDAATNGDKAVAVLDTLGSIALPKVVRTGVKKHGGDSLGWIRTKTDSILYGSKKAPTNKPATPKGNDSNATKKPENKKGDTACCCFVAGTPVLTKQGLKAIEQLEEGELVASRNVETGEVEWKPITKTFIINDDRISYELVLMDEQGTIDKFEVTDNHPFWVEGFGWVDSVDLKSGMSVPSYKGGYLTVVSLTANNRSPVTYNIEVSDFHTYFAGESQALVHNCTSCENNNVTKRDPNDLEPSHPVNLSTKFNLPEHGTVGDLAKKLKDEKNRGESTLADSIKPIEIKKIKGKEFSANNKRWRAFKEAGVEIPTVPASKEQVRKIKDRLSKKK